MGPNIENFDSIDTRFDRYKQRIVS